MDKRSYYQGTEEPTPGKQHYKPEKAPKVQTRFKTPFFRNYDYTDSPSGPGTGLYHNLDKYKSVSDFLKSKKQKKLKDKYKANDSLIEDTKENREERVRKMKTRAKLLSRLTKIAIDFPLDDQIGSGSILGDAGSYSDSVHIGGLGDYGNPLHDFEGKSPDQLNFGRDYEGEPEHFDEEKLHALMGKYLNAKEPAPYGLPDGIETPEDLDPGATINRINPYFGTTDLGITVYSPTPQTPINTI
jgi:hypothetical protein